MCCWGRHSCIIGQRQAKNAQPDPAPLPPLLLPSAARRCGAWLMRCRAEPEQGSGVDGDVLAMTGTNEAEEESLVLAGTGRVCVSILACPVATPQCATALSPAAEGAAGARARRGDGRHPARGGPLHAQQKQGAGGCRGLHCASIQGRQQRMTDARSHSADTRTQHPPVGHPHRPGAGPCRSSRPTHHARCQEAAGSRGGGRSPHATGPRITRPRSTAAAVAAAPQCPAVRSASASCLRRLLQSKSRRAARSLGMCVHCGDAAEWCRHRDLLLAVQRRRQYAATPLVYQHMLRGDDDSMAAFL